jgi:hypothetical protein
VPTFDQRPAQLRRTQAKVLMKSTTEVGGVVEAKFSSDFFYARVCDQPLQSYRHSQACRCVTWATVESAPEYPFELAHTQSLRASHVSDAKTALKQPCGQCRPPLCQSGASASAPDGWLTAL